MNLTECVRLIEGIENPYREKWNQPGAVDLSTGFEACRQRALFLLKGQNPPKLECDRCHRWAQRLFGHPEKRGLYCLSCLEEVEQQLSAEMGA